MPADVRSIAALDDWHAALAAFRTEASEALSSAAMEARRAFDWVADRGAQWKAEFRQAQEAVVQAKMALSRKKLPGYDGRLPDTTVEERDLRRAQAWEDDCSEQIDVCRRWATKLPKLIEEYGPLVRPLGHFLDAGLQVAMADLVERVRLLEAYLATPTPEATP